MWSYLSNNRINSWSIQVGMSIRFCAMVWFVYNVINSLVGYFALYMANSFVKRQVW